MDIGTLVTLGIVVLVVAVLLFLIRASGLGRRRPQLRPLAPGARDRYINEWDQIEMMFIDAPEEAVRQAETLVMSVLRERGHKLSDRDLPDEMKRAHKHAYEARDRTEGMRQAMLQYRAMMVRHVGPEDAMQKDREPQAAEDERQRREMA
jgi:hypothetical protein